MKGIRFFLIFVVLSASLLCTAEAGRSGRTSSNQNSFRRAANGFYQALSSVFGEDNIRGLYKVRGRDEMSSTPAGFLRADPLFVVLSMANRKEARARPSQTIRVPF